MGKRKENLHQRLPDKDFGNPVSGLLNFRSFRHGSGVCSFAAWRLSRG
jgi:hypothetical protein